MRTRSWEVWLESDEVRRLLWQSKKNLRVAWQRDQHDPKSYPMNTAYVLEEIREGLSGKSHTKSRNSRIPAPRIPKSLSELIPERAVKGIWEERYSGRFEDAIKRASGANVNNPKDSWRAFQSILYAIEKAYYVQRWDELLPRPKVNILHRELTRIANALRLNDLTRTAFAEFFDDICPCGLKRHNEALRKSLGRSSKSRRKRRVH